MKMEPTSSSTYLQFPNLLSQFQFKLPGNENTVTPKPSKGKAIARLASPEPETPVSKSSSGSENQLPTPSTDIRNDAVSPSPDDDYDYSRDEEEDSEDEFLTVGMDNELDDEFISVEPEDELDDEDEEDNNNDEVPFLLTSKRLRSGKQPLAARNKTKKEQPIPSTADKYVANFNKEHLVKDDDPELLHFQTCLANKILL
ncbi:hypothetical protein FDECE_15764 [Fusarium decemcellulare]|nr:hypothetical protein FDECE_15764 [Fusarium decemcellulare]